MGASYAKRITRSSELRNVNEVDDFSDCNDSIELTDFSAT